MSNDSNVTVNNRLGCGAILFIVTIILAILKLAEIVEISWWLVVAPVGVYAVGWLVGFLIVVLIAGVVLAGAFIVALIAAMLDK
jgi:flagellar biosynthesis protein FliR